MTILALVLVLVPQDKKEELRVALAKTKAAKSYEFKIVWAGGKKKGTISGMWSEKIFYARSDQGEIVSGGDRTVMKVGGGEWRRAPSAKAVVPHAIAEVLVRAAPAVKKERSGKVHGVVVDIYVYVLGAEATKRAFQSLWGAFLDWTKAENGALFYVGRSDKRIYRIEVRRGSTTPAVTLDFSRYDRAKPPRHAEKALRTAPQ